MTRSKKTYTKEDKAWFLSLLIIKLVYYTETDHDRNRALKKDLEAPVGHLGQTPKQDGTRHSHSLLIEFPIR